MIVGKEGSMLHFYGNECDNDREESIGKDTKGCRWESTVGSVFGWFKLGGHDQFLHVPPGEVGCLQPQESEQ